MIWFQKKYETSHNPPYYLMLGKKNIAIKVFSQSAT